MILKISKENLYLYLSFTFFTLLISYFIANRDLSSVDDNLIYAENFLSKNSIDSFYYEFLFDLLTFIVRFFTDSYIIYFFILNLFLNFTLFFLAKKICELTNINKFSFIFIFFSFCLLSSWYQVAAANGLRQGLSLTFLYLFFVYFTFNMSRIYSVLFLIISIFFHYSSILILPFVVLIKLNLNKLFFIVNIFAVLYFLQINEKIVYFLSSFLGIPLYDSIKNYVEDADSYRYGFQLDLFLYSMILAYLYYFILKYFFNKNDILNHLIKIYYICLFPYFLFGFAAFSNRYGLFAWFFSILVNSLIFYLFLSVKKSFFALGFFSIYFLSILYFIIVFKII